MAHSPKTIKQVYTLEEIRDALASLSRGGDPDAFIPYIVKGKIVLEWHEDES